MTFDELVREVATTEGWANSAARRIVANIFELVTREVLHGSGRVNVPQFGVFIRRVTPPNKRPVGGVLKKLRGSTRVVFRVSSGAKVSE